MCATADLPHPPERLRAGTFEEAWLLKAYRFASAEWNGRLVRVLGPSGLSGPMVDAVVLAAGASTRSGETPKALLRPEAGTSVVRLIVASAFAAGAERTIVVLGAHAESVRRELDGTSAVGVVHPRWATGRTGSVKAGLAARGGRPGWVLLWPVDHPFVRAGTVRSLFDSARTSFEGGGKGGVPAAWLVPTYQGKRGHPVLLSEQAQREVLTYGDDEPLFRYPRGHPGEVREVAVLDPGILENIDTPEAWAAARDRWLREDRAGNLPSK